MSTTIKYINCIICPISCQGRVLFEDNDIKDIIGFTCQRGILYAKEEVVNPRRILTTTVPIIGGKIPLLPVMSKGTLPKEKIIDGAKCLTGICVKAPVYEGDVVYPNILNLGIDIVATRDIEADDVS